MGASRAIYLGNNIYISNVYVIAMSLISKLLQFVISTVNKYNIDESHGLGHSMNVLIYSHNIFNHSVQTMPELHKYERIIYVSAIVHDMCDKKYMDEENGIREISGYLHEKIPEDEIDAIKKIISTMSYSKVKINGFPELGVYQTAFHIVREADLLTAYDFDRCMIYNMHHNKQDLLDSYLNAHTLLYNRVFKHYEDGLFVTEYSKQQHFILQHIALNRISMWEKILNINIV